jgi:hypothetical protein
MWPPVRTAGAPTVTEDHDRPVLHHAYIREGESLPEGVLWTWVRHAASRDEGIGLDIWWFDYEEEA